MGSGSSTRHPTANLDPAAFENTLDKEEEGVYIGWAALEDASLPPESRKVHKAVLSIGWNPTFQNEQRTVEAYLCHDFGHDSGHDSGQGGSQAACQPPDQATN